jgi:hypothetical protein
MATGIEVKIVELGHRLWKQNGSDDGCNSKGDCIRVAKRSGVVRGHENVCLGISGNEGDHGSV